MTARKRILSTTARLVFAVGAIGTAAWPCPAPGAEAEAWPSWPQAVRAAEQTGRPIALVVTSRSNPASQEFRRALAARVAARPQACSAQFTELPVEANPELTKKLGITATPTLLLYRRGASGLVLVGRKSPPFDAATALTWLADSLKPARPGPHDPDVMRTLGHKTAVVVQPSPQQVGQPQVLVPQQPVAQQPVTAAIQAAPTVTMPITGPQAAPIVLQPASAPIVVQPAPMQVLVGPTPAPVVTFVQAPSPAPQVSLAAPVPTQPNLFVSGPQVQPPQPSLPSPQQQAQVAAPIVAQAMAVPQQTVALAPAVPAQAGAGVQAALVLQQPNLINRMLAGLGRHLAQKGNPRVVMSTAAPLTVQVPTAVAVPAQAPSVAAPQQVTSVSTVPAPPAIVASPQAAPRHGLGGLLHP